MNQRLNIQTVTPLSVGTGEEMSPITDFFIEDNKVHYINKEVFDNHLVDNDDLMTLYTSEIISGVNESFTRSNFDLHRFIKNKMLLSNAEVVEDSYPIYGVRQKDKRQIKTLVSNGHYPYIPGSSLKGAFKTALLYDWLQNDTFGQKEILSIVPSITRLHTKLSDLLDDVESFSKELKDARKNRVNRQTQNEIKRDLRNATRKLRGEIRPLEYQIDDAIKKMFGDIRKSKRERMDFSLFRIADSTPCSNDHLAVYNTERLSIKKGTLSVPVVYEAIVPDVFFTADLQLLPEFKHSYLRFLNQADAVTVLFEKINEFALDFLEFETQLLDDLSDKIQQSSRNDKPIYIKYYNGLNDVFDRVEAAKDTGFLCLGGGKSYWLNSMGLAIYKKDKTAFSQFVRLFQLGEPDQTYFPITRTITTGNSANFQNQSLGWIQLNKS